jgi:hypothetical protein
VLVRLLLLLLRLPLLPFLHRLPCLFLYRLLCLLLLALTVLALLLLQLWRLLLLLRLLLRLPLPLPLLPLLHRRRLLGALLPKLHGSMCMLSCWLTASPLPQCCTSASVRRSTVVSCVQITTSVALSAGQEARQGQEWARGQRRGRGRGQGEAGSDAFARDQQWGSPGPCPALPYAAHLKTCLSACRTQTPTPVFAHLTWMHHLNEPGALSHYHCTHGGLVLQQAQRVG